MSSNSLPFTRERLTERFIKELVYYNIDIEEKMDARYLMTALIPVVPVVGGLVKMLTGDLSDAHQSLVNFVDGVKTAAPAVLPYVGWVGCMWLLSYAAQAGKAGVSR